MSDVFVNTGNRVSPVDGAGTPPIDVPKNNPSSPTTPLSSGGGAAQTGGVEGSQIIQPEIGGDLGSLYLDNNKFQLLSEARRRSSFFNGISRVNNRYRGHRESGKFNLIIQKFLTISCSLFSTLKPANTSLTTTELADTYPTEEEIQHIQHINIQITYKEWLLMKDDDKRWF